MHEVLQLLIIHVFHVINDLAHSHLSQLFGSADEVVNIVILRVLRNLVEHFYVLWSRLIDIIRVVHAERIVVQRGLFDFFFRKRIVKFSNVLFEVGFLSWRRFHNLGFSSNILKVFVIIRNNTILIFSIVDGDVILQVLVVEFRNIFGRCNLSSDSDLFLLVILVQVVYICIEIDINVVEVVGWSCV